jgi:hypothetical protein
MEELEIWKDIPGYEGRYQISNQGNVKTLTRIVSSYRSSYTRRGKVLNKYYGGRTGYYKVKLYTGIGTFESFPVHRLVAQSFLENLDNYPQINHKDGNPKNNNVNNLEWVNNSINIQHAYDTGLININNRRGVNHYKATLTEEQVINMRKDHSEENVSYKELATKYNIKLINVYNIISRNSWKHV